MQQGIELYNDTALETIGLELCIDFILTAKTKKCHYANLELGPNHNLLCFWLDLEKKSSTLRNHTFCPRVPGQRS